LHFLIQRNSSVAGMNREELDSLFFPFILWLDRRN
jgi:hypothetical protein